MLSKAQVKQLENLLHEDYHGSVIRIVPNRVAASIYDIRDTLLCWKHSEFKRELKHLWDVATGKIDGNYNSILKTTSIFNYNIKLKDRENRLYYSTFVLFHELRHHYQNKHNRLQRHDIETDCDRFALRMLNKHYSEIMSIISEKS